MQNSFSQNSPLVLVNSAPAAILGELKQVEDIKELYFVKRFSD
ncbi:hypothetical protein [Hahella sp. NBU794]